MASSGFNRTLDAINNVFRKFSAFHDETGRLNVDGRSEERRVGKECRNSKDLPRHRTDQLALRMTYLIMQTTQHISLRQRVGVLNNFIHNPQCGHGLFVVVFKKKTAAIIEYRGLFFFSSRRRHTSSVSAFLLNRSSDL